MIPLNSEAIRSSLVRATSARTETSFSRRGRGAEFSADAPLGFALRRRRFRLRRVGNCARGDAARVADRRNACGKADFERNEFGKRIVAGPADALAPFGPFARDAMCGRIDRASVLALGMLSSAERSARLGLPEDFTARRCRRLAPLAAERGRSLGAAPPDLADDCAAGRKSPAASYTFTMYNDPRLDPERHGRGAVRPGRA